MSSPTARAPDVTARVRVAFVSLYAYPLFDPSCRSIFGGSEVRTWLFANALARRPGRDVAVVVLDHGQPSPARFGAVTVYAHSFYRAEAAGGALGWLRRRFAGAARGERDAVYAATGADLILVPGVTPLTLEVAAFCRARGVPYVVLLGSDVDLEQRGADYDALLADAACTVAQTASQERRLAGRAGARTRIIRNPVALDGPAPPLAARREHVLWIGKSDDIKRPHLLLRLAQLAPRLRFVMVMNRSDAVRHDDVLRRAPPNVRILEQVPFGESDRLFARAIALVNTSRFEGFPNTFLQAARSAVPILSLDVDPDGFIERAQCGTFAAGDEAKLAAAMEALAADPASAERLGRNARRYVEEFHALDARAAQLDELITEVAPCAA